MTKYEKTRLTEFKKHYLAKFHKDSKFAISHAKEPNIMSFLGMPEMSALYPCYNAYADALGDIDLMIRTETPDGHPLLSDKQAKKLSDELDKKLGAVLYS